MFDLYHSAENMLKTTHPTRGLGIAWEDAYFWRCPIHSLSSLKKLPILLFKNNFAAILLLHWELTFDN